ncbi:MAG: imidazole glycerol phosphate synthase cyclase subunit [Candidatus Omnitrophica bacterium]|nr:imidazole glycerol phosphate synthase cyclase subunit [Candidatus Omnitrophota bacterium]
MLKKRLIPVLLLKNGFLVRSFKFHRHNSIGNPLIQTQRYNDWSIDELIFIDITRDGVYDLRRDDQKLKGVSSALEVLRVVSKTCFMPLTFGGKIRSLEDMSVRFENGADKITLNTVCFEDPGIIEQAAKKFGSQAIVASVDIKKHADGSYEVFSHNGSRPTGRRPVEWVKFLESRGVGEIFLNSIDKDGTGEGYDLDLIKGVVDSTNLPVIACGGVGKYEHFVEGIKSGGASAVAAANIFNFKELSDRNARRCMIDSGIDMKPV